MDYIKTFESYSKSIGDKKDIKDTINNLRGGISKEMKEVALELLLP